VTYGQNVLATKKPISYWAKLQSHFANRRKRKSILHTKEAARNVSTRYRPPSLSNLHQGTRKIFVSDDFHNSYKCGNSVETQTSFSYFCISSSL